MLRILTLLFLCTTINNLYAQNNAGKTGFGQPVHPDQPFNQEFSIKYFVKGRPAGESAGLSKIACDRNGNVQILGTDGILKKSGGQFLYPGTLVKDISYLPMLDKKIKQLGLYQQQFVYADDKAILSNAWAGKLYLPHTLSAVKLFCAGADFSFLISDGHTIQYLKNAVTVFSTPSQESITDIQYDDKRKHFLLLTTTGISVFDPATNNLQSLYTEEGITCFTLANQGASMVIGTHTGYRIINVAKGTSNGNLISKLPSPDLTVVKEINHQLWFGSTNAAFRLLPNGKYKYYASKRWLPSNNVVDIAEGSNGTVLVLTNNGLGEIHTAPLTLEEKAQFYEEQVRTRHIRLGLNATLAGMKNGDPSTGSLEDSDNDGLWTSMYLGAEVFRYASTKSAEALENVKESLDAMERLYTITNIQGFPARSFERRGYEVSDVHKPAPAANPGLKQEYPGNASVQSPDEIWRNAAHPEWDWKSTTSSDEAIGHMFVFGAIAELVDETAIKNKAIGLMDALMQHIVDHQWYMIDWNGKPTTWGRWNPEYVNARPKNVGDRKITSSNIISMLQTAWHFTGKKIYKEKAFELLQKHGFLENLMRPMKEIGHAPAGSDQLSIDLSDNWNHSDDEMYFLGYWGLYRYAFNDTLKAKFKLAILDHWQIERPEKEGAWNIFTAMTGVKDFDLKESIWYLQNYPLDMINWNVHNSNRGDVEKIASNFRRQRIKEVLPPDELPINRHNSNRFDLDGGDENGGAEYSAGDIWLLPYWMGRYLKIIEAPVEKKKPVANYTKQESSKINAIAPVVYQDNGFDQRFSIKFFSAPSDLPMHSVASDHNGSIKLLSKNGLYIPRAGVLLQPGTLVKDLSYLPVTGKKIATVCNYNNEYVFADDKAIFSNAWAGKLYVPHHLPNVNLLCAGKDFQFLVSDGNDIELLNKDSIVWRAAIPGGIINIQYQQKTDLYWILTAHNLYSFSASEEKINTQLEGNDFTCFAVLDKKILLGTHHGYLEFDEPYNKSSTLQNDKLPATDITVIKELEGAVWFGTTDGAFLSNGNNGYNYFANEAWLTDNHVVDICKGPHHAVMVLTLKGLAAICTQPMTLEQKAAYYESIVRNRHIRYGYYCDYTHLKDADPSNAQMGPHDSDNLWTSMYLCAELFRYLVTGETEARQNCIESLDAMTRLFELSGIKGLFGRSIERTGTMEFRDEIREENKYFWYPGYEHAPSSWHHSSSSAWDWRGSASSDQAVGQYFALTMVAQYIKEPLIKQKAIRLIDELTGYIVDNDLKLIDVDGKPTLWGRWSPDYVNRFPDMVGDKKLYSSNIIAFLQTAWHFTGKKKYLDKAKELLYKDHYLENLSRPAKEIGPAPATADKWSQLLSGGWNSSDDEMYFLAYWGLHSFSLNDSLKTVFKKAIADHWELIQPEKDALWNISYAAITGNPQFGLQDAVWELQRMPLDLINWKMVNSQRKDLVFVPENHLERPIATVLPPDERPENKHNRNLFKLDQLSGGNAELGGGDVFLLPYWMGRFFGYISAPAIHKTGLEFNINYSALH